MHSECDTVFLMTNLILLSSKNPFSVIAAAKICTVMKLMKWFTATGTVLACDACDDIIVTVR